MDLEEELNRRLVRFVMVSFVMLVVSTGALHYLATSLRTQAQIAASRTR